MSNSANSRLEYIRKLQSQTAAAVVAEKEKPPQGRKKKNRRFHSVTTAMENVEDESSAKVDLSDCVCFRKAKTLVCVNCKHFTYGRTSTNCPVHSNVSYLMDLMHCPNCLGTQEHLHAVDIDYGQYQNITGKPATQPQPERRMASDEDDL